MIQFKLTWFLAGIQIGFVEEICDWEYGSIQSALFIL